MQKEPPPPTSRQALGCADAGCPMGSSDLRGRNRSQQSPCGGHTPAAHARACAPLSSPRKPLGRRRRAVAERPGGDPTASLPRRSATRTPVADVGVRVSQGSVLRTSTCIAKRIHGLGAATPFGATPYSWWRAGVPQVEPRHARRHRAWFQQSQAWIANLSSCVLGGRMSQIHCGAIPSIREMIPEPLSAAWFRWHRRGSNQ